MTLAFVVALSAVCAPLLAAEVSYKSYEGYKIYDVWARSESQTQELQQFYEDFSDSLDFLIASRVVGRPMRILIAPLQEASILGFLRKFELDVELINANVAASVAEAHEQQQQQSARAAAGDLNNFESYLSYADMSSYLDYLAAKYPELVQLQPIGLSYEGRALKAILISNSSASVTESETGPRRKPLMLIDAGIHAREWIAPSAALYVIQQLVENATYHAQELQDFDWLVWPLVNPDGYEYTRQKERMWRKTRKPSGSSTGSSCVGTDANRNFDFHWGGAGTSSDVCADTYKGPYGFSEPETVALRNLMFQVNSSCRMYLTLHSYGSYLLYPWGYEATLPPTWMYLDAVARAGADAIEAASGTYYTVGNAANVLYAAAGASDDYALGVANIPVSITMELPAGGSGFDPPPSKIRPIVEETWVGIKAMAAKVLELGEFEVDEDHEANTASSLAGNIFWNLFF